MRIRFTSFFIALEKRLDTSCKLCVQMYPAEVTDWMSIVSKIFLFTINVGNNRQKKILLF